MIIDGFDYGDGWTKAICRVHGVQLLSDDGTWTSNSIMNTEYYGDVFNQKDFDEAVRKGSKYRRPMTEAEKQAEKAKEEKVEKVYEPFIITVNEYMGESGRPIKLRASEAARIAQLPEVVAEVERQRKEREIKVGDSVFDHRFSRWWVVQRFDGEFYYSSEIEGGGEFCGKRADLVKITMDEYKALEGIKARAAIEIGAK